MHSSFALFVVALAIVFYVQKYGLPITQNIEKQQRKILTGSEGDGPRDHVTFKLTEIGKKWLNEELKQGDMLLVDIDIPSFAGNRRYTVHKYNIPDELHPEKSEIILKSSTSTQRLEHQLIIYLKMSSSSANLEVTSAKFMTLRRSNPPDPSSPEYERKIRERELEEKQFQAQNSDAGKRLMESLKSIEVTKLFEMKKVDISWLISRGKFEKGDIVAINEGQEFDGDYECTQIFQYDDSKLRILLNGMQLPRRLLTIDCTTTISVRTFDGDPTTDKALTDKANKLTGLHVLP